MSTLAIFGRPLNSRGGVREKINVGDTTRVPFQIIYKWTAHWLHSCPCNLADKRNTEHGTLTDGHCPLLTSGQYLCQTMSISSLLLHPEERRERLSRTLHLMKHLTSIQTLKLPAGKYPDLRPTVQ